MVVLSSSKWWIWSPLWCGGGGARLFMMVVSIDISHGVAVVVALVDSTPILVFRVSVLKVLVSVVVQSAIKAVDQIGEMVEAHPVVTVEEAAVDQHLVYLVAMVVNLLLVDIVALVVTLVGGTREISDGSPIVDIQTRMMGG